MNLVKVIEVVVFDGRRTPCCAHAHARRFGGNGGKVGLGHALNAVAG